MIVVIDEKKVLNELVEVKIPDISSPAIVKETLKRMGIANTKTKVITQSCHLKSIKDKWFVIHFKEWYKLLGKQNTLNETDLKRRNAIILLLKNWGLIELDETNEEKIKNPEPLKSIFVLKHSEAKNWTFNKKI